MIINKLGLHARAAMKLVDLAGRYQCSIHMSLLGKQVDAKDILQTMSLGAAKGTLIDFTLDGPNEEEALTAIEQLIQNRFGEAE